MNISTGSRVGPYVIVSRIGAGGMGEVWQAKDSRLDRSVAIKVLPAEFAEDAQLKLRFEREAKTISQLNHPNICTLFDVGDDYLVMELLEGESLADRVARGPLPLSEIVKYGAQIADGLDRAHRNGVIHRDLKPGNVMITKSGAKLLDFGLAKTSASNAVLDGATVQKALTQEGTIVGTFQYMAPEQLEGQEADARTDIFALGALLYEMATGKRAFDGKTKTSLIAAIVSSTPRPIAEIAPLTPPALDHVITKCLEKDPDDRWQSAHDIAEELKWIGSASGQALAVASAPRPKRRWRELAAVVAGILLGAAGAWALMRWRTPRTQVTRTSILPPADAPLAVYGPHRFAITSDGASVAYVGARAGTLQIYVRRLDALDPIALAGTEGGSAPFFSPDGDSVGFIERNHLKRIPRNGGSAQLVCDAPDIRWATWIDNGTIVFQRGTEGLFRVPADGGVPKILAKGNWSGAALTPANTVLVAGSDGGVFAVDRNTGKQAKLLDTNGDVSGVAYTAGHLLYNNGRLLFAIPFDAKRLKATGPPRMIIDNVAILPPFGTPLFAASADGTLIYAAGTIRDLAAASLVAVDRQGSSRPTVSTSRVFEEPRISPDGKRICVTLRESNPDIWVYDIPRQVLTRLTFDAGEEETPVWSPDGKLIAYSAVRGTTHHVYSKPADGSGTEQLLAASSNHAHVGSWAPDASSLAFTDYTVSGGGDIWIATLTGKRETHPLIQTAFNERGPRISRDANWVAYTSDESGRDEVYVQSYPRPGAKFQVSTEGGTEPVWSPAGDELFYRHGDDMMAVRVTLSPMFSPQTPQRLFTDAFVPSRRGEAAYDVEHDGKTFLMLKRQASATPAQIVVVSHFLDDVKTPAGQ
jgi:Tol biopolymer transport system component